MTIFKCKWCNYKFNHSKDIPPETCPYCNKRDSLSEPETAEDILKDSGK